MKIGISLSGGGVRATVFHLGMLRRLAESGQWDEIMHLSTVSGGSIAVALIFGINAGAWPDAGTFIKATLPEARKVLTKSSLMNAYLRLWAIRPWLLVKGRAHLLGRAIEETFGLSMKLEQLPDTPRWTINCTTYETGKNWRFSKKRMGDYVCGYVLNPDFPVAMAVGASAGFPGGIGPLRIKTADYQWARFKTGSMSETEPASPLHHRLQLWDGGVYENLGSEALVKPTGGLRQDIDFYIASDAGKRIGSEFRRFRLGLLPYLPPMRLLDCAMDQIRALRARSLAGLLNQGGVACGTFLQIGPTSEALGLTFPSPAEVNESEARQAANFPTTLRKLQCHEFDLLFRHGYEVSAVLPSVMQHSNR